MILVLEQMQEILSDIWFSWKIISLCDLIITVFIHVSNWIFLSIGPIGGVRPGAFEILEPALEPVLFHEQDGNSLPKQVSMEL